MFFPARRNGFLASGLVAAAGRAAALRREQAMVQQTQQWRSGNGETAWLSALIATMEQVSRPELRVTRCPPGLRAAVEAHLARPTMPQDLYGSIFSLRN
jgi:hypothetical protein